MNPSSPEFGAYLKVIAGAAGVVLIADLVLFWVLIIGWARGRSLLARRWSAAHVLVAFQAWLLPTLIFVVLAGVVAALTAPGGARALSDGRWMRILTLGGLVVQNAAMVGVVLLAVLVIYDQHLVATGLSLRRWGPRAAVGLLVAAVAIPVSLTLEHLSTLALRHVPFLILVQRAYQDQSREIMRMFQGPGGLVLAILVIGVIGPFGEEVFFRGFAYRCFRARWGPTAGIIVSAALFAIIHLHPIGLLPIFFLGCLLAYLYERTGTLVAPFTLHAVNNIVAVLAVYFTHGR